jgi:hypothetical protein
LTQADQVALLSRQGVPSEEAEEHDDPDHGHDGDHAHGNGPSDGSGIGDGCDYDYGDARIRDDLVGP